MQETINPYSYRIKQLRQALGLTQKEFVRIAGITQAALSQYETGERAITWYKAEVILTRFGVNQLWWKTGEGEIFETKSKSSQIPLVMWESLSESKAGTCVIPFFRDVDKICIYPGAPVDSVPTGSYLALRYETTARLATGSLLVIETKAGPFIGRLVSKSLPNLVLENSVTIASSTIISIYAVVGYWTRLV